MSPRTVEDELTTWNFDFFKSKNIFAVYLGSLFFLAYILSLFVAILHVRHNSVVYPLTRPQRGSYLSEYIILVKTSLFCNSSFDYRGRVLLELLGSFSDSSMLQLKKGKDIEYFLERGTVNIFVYHAPCELGDIEQIKITLVNDAPHEIPFVQWRPAYVSVMHPATRRQWGCRISQNLQCFDLLSETFECKANLRDRNGILKSFALHHMWFSMFNSPVRFGMYSNFTNAVMFFFVMTAMLITTLFMQILGDIETMEDRLPKNFLVRNGMVAATDWLLEVILEAFLRNTVPKVNAMRYSLFQGLVEPVQSSYGLHDFAIDYNWDKVRPMMPDRRVFIPMGLRHGSNRCIFQISAPYSYFNLWGRLNLEEERLGSRFWRSLYINSQPLPVAFKWLPKEASSRKEDVMVKQYMNNYSSPICFFDCWIIDWPLHYMEEPQMAGLIISNIICKDIVSITKMRSNIQRARLAQTCVHQWHGLLCCIFLLVVRRSLEQRNKPTSALKSFIYETGTRFGKRSVREIQGTWKARQVRLEQMQSGLKTAGEKEDQPDGGLSDKNVSALSAYKSPINLALSIWHNVMSITDTRSSETDIGVENFDWDENDSFDQDLLIFDNLPEPKRNRKHFTRAEQGAGDGYNKAHANFRAPPKGAPIYTVVQENTDDSVTNRTHLSSVSGAARRRRMPASATNSSQGHVETENIINVSAESVHIDIDSNSNARTDSCPADSTHELASLLKELKYVKTIPPCKVPEGMLRARNKKGFHKDKNANAGVDDLAKSNTNMNANDNNAEKEAELPQKETGNKGDGERISMPISDYEKVLMGPPFDESVQRIKDPDHPYRFKRHVDEMLGYCCDNKRCQANAEIHVKVGVSCLEVLKKILIDLLHFAMDDEDITPSKFWLRKKMVLGMLADMERRAERYDSAMFQKDFVGASEGYKCNLILSSVFTILEVLVNMASQKQQEALTHVLKERKEKFGVPDKPEKRCLFCARKLKNQKNLPSDGCDKEEILVKFFTQSTIVVASKEMTVEVRHKFTLQKYCAMLMNLAKRELLIELEDPPTVLTTKVCRGMVILLLNEMVPKHTELKDMTADELRRMGTRRQRIQARHDPGAAGKKAETDAEKRKKEMINVIVEDLSTKWRIKIKENDLDFCSKLLGQILVHERILGFSVYSGYITKDHEKLLDRSRNRLEEVEKKAVEVVLKVARQLLFKQLQKVLVSGQKVDVLFCKRKQEFMYVMEAVTVCKVLIEPSVLKTCCFYIEDIIKKKIEEFVELKTYIIHLDVANELDKKLKLKGLKTKYEIDNKKVEIRYAKNHAAIASPILRWGPVVIKGVPPVPELIDDDDDLNNIQFKEVIQAALEAGRYDRNLEGMVAGLLRTRRTLTGFMENTATDKSKQLQTHLARIQARITEQISLATQNMSDSYTLEKDFQRDFRKDELYNVEFYATRHMRLPFAAAQGIVFIIILILFTIAFFIMIIAKASNMEVDKVSSWLYNYLFTLVIYGFALEPFKCLVYCVLGIYVD